MCYTPLIGLIFRYNGGLRVIQFSSISRWSAQTVIRPSTRKWDAAAVRKVKVGSRHQVIVETIWILRWSHWLDNQKILQIKIIDKFLHTWINQIRKILGCFISKAGIECWMFGTVSNYHYITPADLTPTEIYGAHYCWNIDLHLPGRYPSVMALTWDIISFVCVSLL